MTYELVIGDRMYSSWSLRSWLLFEQFEIPVKTTMVHMKTETFGKVLAEFPPARLVPAIRVEGRTVWDTIAIAETLAERHLDLGLWPGDPSDRAQARALVAEMHSGFPALRGVCPMNLRTAFAGVGISTDVLNDLDRIATLWALPGQRSEGSWLYGSYTIADAFFAPVAARIAGYELPVPKAARAYVDTHLSHGPFRRWRAMAFAADRPLETYEDNGLERRPWPGPNLIEAEAVDTETAENTLCPFSGKPVAADSLARIDGRIIGFCNQFCRDKAVADPAAWPKVEALLKEV